MGKKTSNLYKKSSRGTWPDCKGCPLLMVKIELEIGIRIGGANRQH